MSRRLLNPLECLTSLIGKTDGIAQSSIMKCSTDFGVPSYQEAVRALNNLQTNAAYLRRALKPHAKNTTLQDTKKYLIRSGINFDELNRVPIIHVAGTKGKGSTCAFLESILRHHGLKTALYTSPHLIAVRERIRINGKPIAENDFTRKFWQVYRLLDSNKENEFDMPLYFKFLTILMFHVITSAKIDVAIVEVGIGGEHDCTNVIENPQCVGITSLGLDHVALLGNSLSSIAWQKAGIFKSRVPAYTVNQAPEALEVLRKRSVEKNCEISVVSSEKLKILNKYPPKLGINSDIQLENAALAVQLAQTFLKKLKSLENQKIFIEFDTRIVEESLMNTRWPGRTQRFRGKNVDVFLDGAHTRDSMIACVKWFENSITEDLCHNQMKKILIFNSTGDRDFREFLDILRPLKFDAVYFVPNVSGRLCLDQENRNFPTVEQMKRCEKHREVWGNEAKIGDSVSQALEHITNEFVVDNGEKVMILVTGSLHLVGATLTVLDPDLTIQDKYIPAV